MFNDYLQKNSLFFIFLSVILLYMAKRLRKPYRRILYGMIIIAGSVCLFLLLRTIYLFVKEIVIILEHNNQEELLDFLRGKSEWTGLFTLFWMSFLQVVSVVLPGMLVQVVGAVIFGWWKAFVTCWLGFVSGNAFVFVIARILGKSVTDALNLDKKGGWLIRAMNRSHPGFVISMASMIPAVPNGIIPYIAARSKLYLSEFVLAVGISCWIQILLNCIAGHFLIRGEYLFTIIAFVLQILLLVVIMKNKDTIMNKLNA